MEELVSFWKDRRVFVTGHTGFKGTWLCSVLRLAGARVFGYALEPESSPSMFEVTDSEKFIESTIGDIRDLDRLRKAVQNADPEVVFHLAAQPFVRRSYNEPLETFDVNVMGTANLLEVCRSHEALRSIVVVTSDKCYENREWEWGYRENESMGGHDPYSASKGCAELVASSFRRSFFSSPGSAGLATARAGNVIGGGDWAEDRLLPDVFRAVESGTVLKIRSPDAVRPWQHVLEPVFGYLLLASALFKDSGNYSSAWNFGPVARDAVSVESILVALSRQIGFQYEVSRSSEHEAQYLYLDSSKASRNLGWNSRTDLDWALTKTVEWHQSLLSGNNAQEVTERQILEFQSIGSNKH